MFPSLNDLRAALQPRITVVREINEGGQRRVYEVAVDDERRVLKLMTEEGRERAEREVTIAREFDHPNLPRIADNELQEVQIKGESFVYFTEEFIEGTTLADRKEPLTPCEVLKLGAQLTEAVAHLWNNHHVVHRDIKPQNIMIRPDGIAVLLDTGVARHQDLQTLTADGFPHQPGTIGYLAPEQLSPRTGRKIDYRADLFAIGIVMYEQLTGRLPFDPQAPSYRTRLASGPGPDTEDMPPVIANLLSRLLAPCPHGRFRLGSAIEAFNLARQKLGCS